jgi:hypothetical protein
MKAIINRENTWEVIVGNIGTVFNGTDGAEAMRTYGRWKELSLANYGRCGNEEVTLFKNSEVIFNHFPQTSEI